MATWHVATTTNISFLMNKEATFIVFLHPDMGSMALKVLKGRTSTDIYPAQEWLTQSVLEEERHQLLSLPPKKQSLSK